MKNILVCTGFHRSATSLTANLLNKSGLSMGNRLMRSNISNRGGHYEDIPLVKIHDGWLSENGTSWQYHDELDITVDDLFPLQSYVNLRDSLQVNWGVKDPRACLFLTEWKKVLGARGRYLFVLRHWSSSIESLLNRHSREVAHELVDDADSPHFNFWKKPTLAAEMWLAYCRRILVFARQNKSFCLLVTQRALINDAPIIENINKRFGFDLSSSVELPFENDWLNDKANKRLLDILPSGLVFQLEVIWEELLGIANFKTGDEKPNWFNSDDIGLRYDEKVNSLTNFRSIQQTLPKLNTTRNSVENDFESLDVYETLLAIKSSDEIEAFFKNLLSQKTVLTTEKVNQIVRWIDENYAMNPQVNIALGQWLQNHSQWESALTVWLNCLKFEKIYPFVYFHIAQCHYYLHHNASSIQSNLEKAINGNPNNANFWLFKGNYLVEKGQLGEALECYKKASSLNPDRPAIILPYCEALSSNGEDKLAFEMISDLYLKLPNNKGVQNMRISLAFACSSELGKQLYDEVVIEKLTKQNKSNWLLKSPRFVGCRQSEIDLLSRVCQHWQRYEND